MRQAQLARKTKETDLLTLNANSIPASAFLTIC